MIANIFRSVLFLLLVLQAGDVFAARFSGDYLLSVCGRNEKGGELVPGGHMACQAYIAGVLDYHSLMRSTGNLNGLDFCVPDETSLYKLQDQIASYVFKHRQQHRNFIATPAIALALNGKYPCRK
jgi:hypothetical protein